jgi:glutamate dehydrogenase/leucine dehydrogenase
MLRASQRWRHIWNASQIRLKINKASKDMFPNMLKRKSDDVSRDWKQLAPVMAFGKIIERAMCMKPLVTGNSVAS